MFAQQVQAAQPVDSDGMGPVQFLSRWQPQGEPLYHRRLSSQWHDMCAESLGMPKVALCFLTRGPMHQVYSQWSCSHQRCRPERLYL